MTINTPMRRLAPTLAIGIALIVSGCNAQDQGAATDPAAVQDQFEMVNIAGGLYQAGVRGMGGHTTVLLVTDGGVILGDPIRAPRRE